jgi:hypothetical protein
LSIAGLVTICNPVAARAPHRWYAWLKLPLALLSAACAGAYVTYFVTREPQVISVAALLGVIVSAVTPCSSCGPFAHSDCANFRECWPRRSASEHRAVQASDPCFHNS